MADFVELGAEGVNWVVENHWEKGYDGVGKLGQKVRGRNANDQTNQAQNGNSGQNTKPSQYGDSQSIQERTVNIDRSGSGKQRKQRNRLPSPEGNAAGYYEKENYRDVDNNADFSRSRRSRRRDSSLEKQSETSEQVIRAYERERDDPRRKPETVLSNKDLKKLRRDSKMSYANGYGASNLQAPAGRPQGNSQPPPRSRYYDDDDESDYDERSGRRYRASGRGYDDDDRDYDREVTTTERYRGTGPPLARGIDRRESYGTQRGGNDPYGPGAVTQYRRSTNDLDEYQSKRSRSRGRREKDRGRDRDRDYSGSRSRSRSHSGIRGKIDETFDTSMKGLGVGLAGAVVGGMAGRQFGKQHRNRDIVLGALIGGLGANAAENKFRDYYDDKKQNVERDEDRWEQKYDGRSRSAMR